MNVPDGIRLAAVLHWVVGVGGGACCLPGIRNLSMGGDIPLILGFPAYGRGPFERRGVPTSVPLLAVFLLICVLEAVAGGLLWGGHRSGAILTLAVLPAAVVFWWGFDLPIPPVFAFGWTVLLIVYWNRLV